jgi:hypothetical protein
VQTGAPPRIWTLLSSLQGLQEPEEGRAESAGLPDGELGWVDAAQSVAAQEAQQAAAVA